MKKLPIFISLVGMFVLGVFVGYKEKDRYRDFWVSSDGKVLILKHFSPTGVVMLFEEPIPAGGSVGKRLEFN